MIELDFEFNGNADTEVIGAYIGWSGYTYLNTRIYYNSNYDERAGFMKLNDIDSVEWARVYDSGGIGGHPFAVTGNESNFYTLPYDASYFKIFKFNCGNGDLAFSYRYPNTNYNNGNIYRQVRVNYDDTAVYATAMKGSDVAVCKWVIALETVR